MLKPAVIIHNFRDAFESQGNGAFRVWAYTSHHKLEEVLDDNYFQGFIQALRPGDLIYVGLHPSQTGYVENAPLASIHRAVLMITELRRGPGGVIKSRLAQDFGTCADPDAPRQEAQHKVIAATTPQRPSTNGAKPTKPAPTKNTKPPAKPSPAKSKAPKAAADRKLEDQPSAMKGTAVTAACVEGST